MTLSRIAAVIICCLFVGYVLWLLDTCADTYLIDWNVSYLWNTLPSLPRCFLVIWNATITFLLRITKIVDYVGSIIDRHRLGTALIAPIVLPYILARIWNYFNNMTTSVREKLENPNPPTLIREGEHFKRDAEENEVRIAFLNKTDTLGLVGVVFGPAGTGKSNVVRSICRNTENKTLKGVEGVVYIEVGSPHQFAYHLAKACGVPVEPNLFDVVISKLFSAWKTHITLPSNDEKALALILPVIAEGCKAYKDRHNRRIPVLFIDGVDILAKQNKELYINLVDWGKKLANEDSLRIVLVCSDSHVLALDQQSFKSRLDTLIEIDDVSEQQAVEALMMHKYGFDKNLAEEIYKIVGGRLADIHKVVAVWRKSKQVFVPQEVVNVQKKKKSNCDQQDVCNALNCIKNCQEDKSEEITDPGMKELIRGIIRSLQYTRKESEDLIRMTTEQFNREMRQAVCKVLCKGHQDIKKYIAETVLKATNPITVEDIALRYADRSHIEEVIAAIQEFLDHNVLRITKYRTLLCYNKAADVVLREVYNKWHNLRRVT